VNLFTCSSRPLRIINLPSPKDPWNHETHNRNVRDLVLTYHYRRGPGTSKPSLHIQRWTACIAAKRIPQNRLVRSHLFTFSVHSWHTEKDVNELPQKKWFCLSVNVRAIFENQSFITCETQTQVTESQNTHNEYCKTAEGFESIKVG